MEFSRHGQEEKQRREFIRSSFSMLVSDIRVYAVKITGMVCGWFL
jgi:hypothetical protein